MKDSVDVIFIGTQEDAVKIHQMAQEFGYSFATIENIGLILDSNYDPHLMYICELPGGGATIDELTQLCRQQFPNAVLALFVEKEFSTEHYHLISKFRADVVMLKSEMNSSKVTFATSQMLHAHFIAFKGLDLVPDIVIPFPIYHLLPQRRKFLLLNHEGTQLSEDRRLRFAIDAEFYFPKERVMQYKKYIETTSDKTDQGLGKRCRANFIALQTEFTRLALEVSDQSNRVSFGQGQKLLSQCQDLCQELLINLAEFPQAWKIINNSSVGDFGSLERATAVAAYCGMFALQMGLNQIEEMMLISLLVDIGVLSLPEKVCRKIRARTNHEKEELQSLHQIPQKSLNMMLSRKLAISEKVRSILMGVYEHADGSGYPHGINDQTLSIESQLIRLAKEFDAKISIKLGEAKVSPEIALHQIFASDKLSKIFSVAFKKLVEEKLYKNGQFAFADPIA